METTITLKSLFSASRIELSSKLNGLSLPKDSQRVQRIVSDYLGDLFENDGSFRQSLTESEDFLFQATYRLLQSQQDLAMEFAKADAVPAPDFGAKCKEGQEKPCNGYLSVAGAGVGALAGSFIGTWAAVAGAIAVTALTIYCSSRSTKCKNAASVSDPVETVSLNADAFCTIVERICESIDGVIDTYRVQVKRIANMYEQRETPSLMGTYSSLVEQIALVLKTTNDCSDEVPAKLKNAVENLAEGLENYGLVYNNGKIING